MPTVQQGRRPQQPATPDTSYGFRPCPGLEPPTSHESILAPFHRPGAFSLVTLETTGVSPHHKQPEFWHEQSLLKSSLVAKLREVGCLDIASKLDTCHTEPAFARCDGCGRVRKFWNRCEAFFCPCCQPALTHERAESIEWWTHTIQQPKHLVLTIANTPEITFGQVATFKSNLTKLRRSKCARAWTGGTWSLELTNRGAGWHLHAHLLIDTKWVDLPSVTQRWAELNHQPDAIIHVGDARSPAKLAECTKYVCKPNQMAAWTGSQIAQAIHALSGHKCFGVFGSLYGKRTQWKEWLCGLRLKRRTCECGCNHWTIFSEAAWLAHEAQLAPCSPTKPRAPETTPDLPLIWAYTSPD